MNKFLRYFLLLLAVGIAGCGYTTRAYVEKTGYSTIYVKPFVNKVDTTTEYSEGRRFKTYYPLLENKVTNAVVDKYNMDGNLRVTREEDADVVLKSELISYRREAVRVSDENPEEYRITLFVHMVLLDNKTKKVLWEKNDFSGDASYFATGPSVKSESQGLDDACQDLARRIVETTVEVW